MFIKRRGVKMGLALAVANDIMFLILSIILITFPCVIATILFTIGNCVSRKKIFFIIAAILLIGPSLFFLHDMIFNDGLNLKLWRLAGLLVIPPCLYASALTLFIIAKRKIPPVKKRYYITSITFLILSLLIPLTTISISSDSIIETFQGFFSFFVIIILPVYLFSGSLASLIIAGGRPAEKRKKLYITSLVLFIIALFLPVIVLVF